MRTTQGRSRLSVLEIASGPEIAVFRIMRAADIDDPAFLDSFRSHYELSEEPRKVERRWTIMHMGISVYRTSERAIETALTWPQLGRHVARLRAASRDGLQLRPYGTHRTLDLMGRSRQAMCCNDQRRDCELVEIMNSYVILDSTANLVDSFDQEQEARLALESIIRQDPESADEYALLTYNDDGHPVGNALVGSDLGVHA